MSLPPLAEVEEAPSTNDNARELALAGAPQGAAILAARQTAGRGRAGRGFASPEGGLYLSVVVRPARQPREWALLALLAGVVVAGELRRRGFDASVKWPNDVMIAGKKAGGVLVESRWGSDPFAVVGIGLNLRDAPLREATSLAQHGSVPDRRALALALRDALVARVEAWERDGSAPLLRDVRAACSTLGKEVEWEGGEGRAVDVDDDGALVVESQGARRRVVVGDVRVRVRA